MEKLNKDQLIDKTIVKFKLLFDVNPTKLSLTPGRINIIGEHTDYNEGIAAPAAIDRWICNASALTNEQYCSIYSMNYRKIYKFKFNKIKKSNDIWKKLAFNCITILKKKYNIDQNINIVLAGNIPIGCGLSSSTAFVISIVNSINQLFKLNLCKMKLVEISQYIENFTLGTAGGRLDQYGIIFSKSNHFMITDFKKNSIEYFPIISNKYSWIILNSKITRELSKSAYLNRVNECKQALEIIKSKFPITSFREIELFMLNEIKFEDEILYKRLLHVLNENKRVFQMKNCIINENIVQAGKILINSHVSLKNLYEVSCKEIDFIIQNSKNFDGWYGGRIIGGGFGGCSIHLINSTKKNEFVKYIFDKYLKKYKIKLDNFNIKFINGIRNIDERYY